jgi:two-component system, NtrC family, response regulator AtoC
MSRRATVLLVDDEAYIRESLAELLARRGFEVRTASEGRQALAAELLEGCDAVITDLRMPGLAGRELVTALVERWPGLPVLVLTAHGAIASAVDCLRAGAADYLLKPIEAAALEVALERALERAARGRELEFLRRGGRAEAGTGERLIGDSPAWREVVQLVEVVAPSDTTVLLEGETGTGKEEIARLMHRLSSRATEALVVVNCAAIPPELFESELFGHRRGAFTGASADRDGRFRVADGGTLVLDEVNSLPLVAQAKLLRVLEDGSFERVGESRPTRVDVRLVCATNADLDREVREGRFRADLLYRIKVVPIRLPPLRERAGDVRLLAEAFVAELAARFGRATRGLDEEAIAALESYAWPGNVRELRNVLERAVLLERGPRISRGSLPLSPSGGVPAADSAADLNLRRRVAEAERQTLLAALERARGVRKHAAELLGVDDRNLSYYLRKHGLMGWRPRGDEE